MNKEAKKYMDSVIDVIVRKYPISEYEACTAVKKSFLHNSLINHLEETLHDEIETNADFVYEDLVRKAQPKSVGRVKRYINHLGYGFIENNYEENIFVHYSNIKMSGYKTLKIGEIVEFDIITTDKGKQAINVSKVAMWHDVREIPDEHKPIVVLDKNGDVHDNHIWVGHAYYEFVDCDGYRSDRDIVGWKYENINKLKKI